MNPTCPHCHAPMQVVAAAPLSGGLAILLECEYWHQSVKWLPRSRFIEPDTDRSIRELLLEIANEKAQIAGQAYSSIGRFTPRVEKLINEADAIYKEADNYA